MEKKKEYMRLDFIEPQIKQIASEMGIEILPNMKGPIDSCGEARTFKVSLEFQSFENSLREILSGCKMVAFYRYDSVLNGNTEQAIIRIYKE